MNYIQSGRWFRVVRVFAGCLLGMLAGSTRAGNLYVPNASFEGQPTFFADPRIDFWQKPPQPGTFDTNIFGSWDNLAGVFINPPATNAEHIVNADGNQLAYIFAYPEVAFFQDNNSTDWSNAAPSHALNATFKSGKSYTLTAGLTSSSEEPLNPGATLQLSLYYRDASNNIVAVAATTATYNTTVFSNLTQLVDFQATVPEVFPGDPWAGKTIGVQLLSTVPFNLIGGVWDIDNVRVVETVATAIHQPVAAPGQFGLTVQSEPGATLEILATADPSQSVGSWASLLSLANVTGSFPFTDTNAPASRRFYLVRELAPP